MRQEIQRSPIGRRRLGDRAYQQGPRRVLHRQPIFARATDGSARESG